MTRLALSGLVELKAHEDGERWYVTKFAERQAPSPVAKRVREFRKRQRKEKEAKRKEEEKITETDTDTYSNVTYETKRYTDVTEDVTHTPAYDGHEENQETHQKILTVSSKIAGQVSDVYPGLKDDDFHKVAHSIILMGDRAIERIDDFGDWWTVNTFYKDDSPPTLKTFASKYKPFLAGVQSKDKANFKNQASGYHVSGSI
jgi:hypothetical protein